MGKLFLFMMVSVDGYFEGKNHDLSWHNVDDEFNNNFIIPQTKRVKTILFGRKTYEMMFDFWSSEEARKTDPITTELMNKTQKFVFSKTLKKVGWKNTTLVKDNVEKLVKNLKKQPGGDIAIFGSNNLMVYFAEKNLIDEFRIIVNPIAIGVGTPLFKGLKKKIRLELKGFKSFQNGKVLLTYTQIKNDKA